jgi:hypothetical protein
LWRARAEIGIASQGDFVAAQFVDDSRDPKATRDAVATHRRKDVGRRSIFDAADCCDRVLPLEGRSETYWVERGLFAHRRNGSGTAVSALPLPIAPAFRETPAVKKAPKL